MLWSCKQCTYLNNAKDNVCIMCYANGPNQCIDSSSSSSWQCKECTMRSSSSKAICDTCFNQRSERNEDRHSCSSSNDRICEVCTLNNAHHDADECEACTCPLAKLTSRTKKQYNSLLNIPTHDANTARKSSGSREIVADDDEEEEDRLFRFAAASFADHVEETLDANQSKGGALFRCKIDGKVCRTKNLMIAYLVKKHSDLLQRNDSSASFSSSSAAAAPVDSSAVAVNSSTVADEEVAWQLAFNDYDALQQQNQRSSSSSSSGIVKDQQQHRHSNNRKRSLTSTLWGDHSNEEHETVEVAEEAMKNIRLQKLLRKTDRFVTKIQQTMKSIAGNANMNQSSNSSSCSSSHHQSYSLISTTCRLREYQQGGVEWLYSLHVSNLNGILADEMGLGKTIQVLAFLSALYDRCHCIGPHLIVMPLSVLSSWRSDLNELTQHDAFNYYIHHGEKESRIDEFAKWCRLLKKERKLQQKQRVAIVLTTYELVIKDLHLFNQLKGGSIAWEYLVVDEAHRLRSRHSQLFGSLQRIHQGRRLLLSGTPLQNNLNELWSLLSFILPDLFSDMQQFNDWFNRPFESDDEDEDLISDNQFQYEKESLPKKRIKRSRRYICRSKNINRSGFVSSLLSSEENQAIISSLHRVIKPFLLRRLKEDVLPDLPPKYEKILLCPLSALQRKIYEKFRKAVEMIDNAVAMRTADNWDQLEQELERSVGQHFARLNSKNLLIELRKLCNHPFLVLESMKSIPDELYFKQLIQSSGKLWVLEQLLNELVKKQNSKVLIFSQMTTTLDVLHGFLQMQGIVCSRLDGGTSQEDRQRQLHDFNNIQQLEQLPKDVAMTESKVFLLSTRAGGVGINLQTADTVILFDSDWNPQQDLQAISRAHRIGQTKPVLVLRLISLGPDKTIPSVEQHLLRRAMKKLEAGENVLARGQFDMGTIDELMEAAPSDSRFMRSLFDDGSIFEDSASTTSATTTESAAESEIQQTIVIDSTVKLIQACERSYSKEPAVHSSGNYIQDAQLLLDEHSEQFLHEWDSWLSTRNHEKEGQEDSSLSTRRSIKQSSSTFNEDSYWRDQFAKAGIEYDDDHQPRNRSVKKRKRNMSEDVANRIDNDDELEEQDICALCGEAWVTADHVETYCELKLQQYMERQQHNDQGVDDMKIDSSSNKRSTSDISNVMILCDGCNGSYHMICVGLDEVPESDWYCQWCSAALKD